MNRLFPRLMTSHRPRLSRLLPSVLLLGLLLALPACQSTNRLREAQDAFNSAATQDNRSQLAELRLSGATAGLPAGWNQSPGAKLDGEVVGTASSRAGYAAALLSLQHLSSDDVSKLKADKLWGTALTLKALAQWRLGQFDDALNTVRDAEKSANGQIYPRDAALLTALPGLIEIDYAYAQLPAFKANPTNATGILDTWRRRLVSTNSTPPSAIEQLRQAQIQAGGEGELAIYLTLSQLAAYRNFNEYYKTATGNTPPANDPAREEAGYALFELEKLIADQNGGQAGTDLVNSWKNRYVIVPKPRPPVPGAGQ
ncbi:MAG: hypothetical protein RIS76_3566 [Verrucomicrobiota bacterium]